MTTPETPPPDVHAAALALTSQILWTAADGSTIPWPEDFTRGDNHRRILELFQAFADAIVEKAKCEATLLAVDAWAKERRRELLETTVTFDAPPRMPAAELEIERLTARVAELEEHIRKQHALDGERLRDLVEITEGAAAWRGLNLIERTAVLEHLYFRSLEPLSRRYEAALAALRALAPDPEAARRREERDEAWTDNTFPTGKEEDPPAPPSVREREQRDETWEAEMDRLDFMAALVGG